MASTFFTYASSIHHHSTLFSILPHANHHSPQLHPLSPLPLIYLPPRFPPISISPPPHPLTSSPHMKFFQITQSANIYNHTCKITFALYIQLNLNSLQSEGVLMLHRLVGGSEGEFRLISNSLEGHLQSYDATTIYFFL